MFVVGFGSKVCKLFAQHTQTATKTTNFKKTLFSAVREFASETGTRRNLRVVFQVLRTQRNFKPIGVVKTEVNDHSAFELQPSSLRDWRKSGAVSAKIKYLKTSSRKLAPDPGAHHFEVNPATPTISPSDG